MGVRPPSDGIEDEPDELEFGIAALDARLTNADIDFPADKDELQSRFGHTDIPYDPAGNTMAFGSALEECDQTQFESEQDLLNAIHPVFERKREATTTDILTQLRSLVPF
jgi:hypothetical protein